jgi:hypothetical protein
MSDAPDAEALAQTFDDIVPNIYKWKEFFTCI